MLDKTLDASLVLSCDECGAYFSDLLDPEREPVEVVCQQCLDKNDEDFVAADRRRETLANSLADAYGACPYGRGKLFR